MSDVVTLTRSRAQPGTAILVLLETVAAIFLVISIRSVPWFQYRNHGDVVPIAPDSTGLYLVSWSGWQGGLSDTATMLTAAAPLLLAVALVARLALRRRWTKIVVLVGFAMAIVGAIAAFGDVASISPIPGAAATADTGLWLFAGAAVIGLVVAALDLSVPWRGLLARGQQSSS